MDRNTCVIRHFENTALSLSARRAWIEIRTVKAGTVARVVALRKESVDRNTCVIRHFENTACRSPQGERG